MSTKAERAAWLQRYAWTSAPLAAVAAFLPSLRAGYLADDFVMLRTISILHMPQQAFTHTDIGTIRNHPYRPLWLLYDALLNAVTSSAVLHHIGNIAMYAAASALVVVLARKFVDARVALLAGVIFALYPRHGEAVAWIAGSTDVLAGFLTLCALALLFYHRAPRWALALGVLVGVGAPLAKESGFVIPALAVVLLVALWRREDDAVRRPRLVAVGVLSVGVVLDLVARTLVLHGTGNDVTEPFGLHRFITVIGSQGAATLTTSQMLILVHHTLLVIPAVLAVLLVFGAVTIYRRHDHDALVLLGVGAAWYVIALIPIFNNAVALNNSNGERLLYLPSVGFALAVAAVASPLLRWSWGRVVTGLALVGAGALCIGEANSYVNSGVIRQNVIADTVRVAPRGATIVLLNVPDSYHGSRLLGAGFAQGVARAGRSDVTVLVCAPSIVESSSAQVVHFTSLSGGRILAHSTAGLPFEVPYSGRVIHTSGCSYAPASTGRIAPGLYSDVVIKLVPSTASTIYLWFNAVDVQACTSAVCSFGVNGRAAT